MSYDSHGVHHHDHLCRCPMCRPQPPDEPRTLDLSDVLRSEWLDGGGLAVLIGHMTDEQLVQALHVLVRELERRMLAAANEEGYSAVFAGKTVDQWLP